MNIFNLIPVGGLTNAEFYNCLLGRYNEMQAKCLLQSEKLAQALKEKNDAQERVQFVITARNNTESNLHAQIAKLLTELAALRPPEPKFKVGQILVVNYKRPSYAGQTITVTRITPLQDEIRYWFTEDNVEGFFRENCLRAQTAQEKGE